MVVNTNTSFIEREDMPGLEKDYVLVFIAQNSQRIFATSDGKDVVELKKDFDTCFRSLYFDKSNEFSSHQEELYYSQENKLFGFKKGIVKEIKDNIRGISRFKTKLLVGNEYNDIFCAEDNSAIIDNLYGREDLIKVGGNLYSMNNESIVNSLNNDIVYNSKDCFISGFANLENKLYFSDSYSTIDSSGKIIRSGYGRVKSEKRHNDIKVFDSGKVSDVIKLGFRPYSVAGVSDVSGGVLLFGRADEAGIISYNLKNDRFSSLLENTEIHHIHSVTQVPKKFIQPFLN